MKTVWLAAFSIGAASLCAQSVAPAFAYEGANGPVHWGDLSPQYSVCKTGKEQSPIDIRNAKSEPLPPIQFDYRPVPLRLINNGHTVQVNYASGSSITVGGERYELKQFHFHHPSEERIDGRAFDMVIHLVHANTRGETAVVAVLVSKGAANSTIQKVWASMPKTTGEERAISGEQIDASALLPSNAAYYTYKGSLTTPPCTEGVTWFILKSATTFSPEQIQIFASMFPANARPVQPTEMRSIVQTR